MDRIILANQPDERRVAGQRGALLLETRVRAGVHVVDGRRDLEVGVLAGKRVRQPQHVARRSIRDAVVEHGEARRWQLYEPAVVDPLPISAQIRHVQPGEVHEPAQRHVGVGCRLMLPQDQLVAHQKRHVVFHVHVDDVIEGGELEHSRIVVGRAGERVVQLERVCLVLLGAEQVTEDRVLVTAVHGARRPIQQRVAIAVRIVVLHVISSLRKPHALVEVMT